MVHDVRMVDYAAFRQTVAYNKDEAFMALIDHTHALLARVP